VSILTEETHKDHHKKVEELQDDVEIEVRVVIDTDTIVHPVTVMVTSLYALATDVAMTRV
jgi:hypothetical protein